MTIMANHFQNGIETAKLIWSRIPNSEDCQEVDDSVEFLNKRDKSGVESLDYEVIENYAYREEQVGFYFYHYLCFFCCFCFVFLVND